MLQPFGKRIRRSTYVAGYRDRKLLGRLRRGIAVTDQRGQRAAADLAGVGAGAGLLQQRLHLHLAEFQRGLLPWRDRAGARHLAAQRAVERLRDRLFLAGLVAPAQALQQARRGHIALDLEPVAALLGAFGIVAIVLAHDRQRHVVAIVQLLHHAAAVLARRADAHLAALVAVAGHIGAEWAQFQLQTLLRAEIDPLQRLHFVDAGHARGNRAGADERVHGCACTRIGQIELRAVDLRLAQGVGAPEQGLRRSRLDAKCIHRLDGRVWPGHHAHVALVDAFNRVAAAAGLGDLTS
ncbi:hypothetical protein [Xanthomonas cassavae]|uniref:hypothetical protein n=1 Tax=Xanthomonas cassavae TaxID=56450 RepID=UPI003CCD2115